MSWKDNEIAKFKVERQNNKHCPIVLKTPAIDYGLSIEDFKKIRAEINRFDVHHINGDKENNDPSNLMLLSKSNHHHLHTHGVNHPRWDNGRIDKAGGIMFLSAEKNKGRTMSSVADELGYTQPVPIHQYLGNRGLTWNQL